MMNASWLNTYANMVDARADVRLDAADRCEERSARLPCRSIRADLSGSALRTIRWGVLSSCSCLVEMQLLCQYPTCFGFAKQHCRHGGFSPHLGTPTIAYNRQRRRSVARDCTCGPLANAIPWIITKWKMSPHSTVRVIVLVRTLC
jgi:hypothetical protein